MLNVRDTYLHYGSFISIVHSQLVNEIANKEFDVRANLHLFNFIIICKVLNNNVVQIELNQQVYLAAINNISRSSEKLPTFSYSTIHIMNYRGTVI